MGQPATFVRLAYCNLHCEWCDAWYTWDHRKVDVQATSRFMTDLEVQQEMGPDKLVIITGGEPLLQENAVGGLMRRMWGARTWQYETNGTLMPKHNLPSTQYVVSPKLSNASLRDRFEKRIRTEPLRWFARYPHAWFKFVLKRLEDIEEVRTVTAMAGMPHSRVWLMPEGRSSAELDSRSGWIAEACKNEGWNYSDRLHIRIFGDKRGT
jgi:organic radical activating enzyme